MKNNSYTRSEDCSLFFHKTGALDVVHFQNGRTSHLQRREEGIRTPRRSNVDDQSRFKSEEQIKIVRQ